MLTEGTSEDQGDGGDDSDDGDEVGYGDGDDDTYTDDQASWHDDLGDASGLDTSPDQGLLSSPGPAMEESSFAMVVT